MALLTLCTVFEWSEYVHFIFSIRFWPYWGQRPILFRFISPHSYKAGWDQLLNEWMSGWIMQKCTWSRILMFSTDKGWIWQVPKMFFGASLLCGMEPETFHLRHDDENGEDQDWEGVVWVGRPGWWTKTAIICHIYLPPNYWKSSR